jgi:hypothetical protein
MAALVNADNFNRAESDLFFHEVVNGGGFGKFEHFRDVARAGRQSYPLVSRDSLYSFAVFDLDAGPVTIAMPDPGWRYMALQVIDEEQYVVAVRLGGGTYRFTREEVGTRYMLAHVSTMVIASDPHDIATVHELQDQVASRQASRGRFVVPHWDRTSRRHVREALLELAKNLPDHHQMFGARRTVDPVRHLIGSALGWGRCPEEVVMYLQVTPRANDGTTIHRLVVGDVPVDAFWSLSVYNERGYFEPNDQGIYSINSISAKRGKDGTIAVQFGGCAHKRTLNCIPIPPKWQYFVRLYRPRPEVVSGAWVFPEAEPIRASDQQVSVVTG